MEQIWSAHTDISQSAIGKDMIPTDYSLQKQNCTKFAVSNWILFVFAPWIFLKKAVLFDAMHRAYYRVYLEMYFLLKFKTRYTSIHSTGILNLSSTNLRTARSLLLNERKNFWFFYAVGLNENDKYNRPRLHFKLNIGELLNFDSCNGHWFWSKCTTFISLFDQLIFSHWCE